MKTLKLLFSSIALVLLSACSPVTEDPRSRHCHSYSPYSNTDSGSSDRGGGGSSSRAAVTAYEPQPTPIRVKPGSQPTQYRSKTSPYDRPSNPGPSPYDQAGGASPLRHDKPDQTPYTR